MAIDEKASSWKKRRKENDSSKVADPQEQEE
jgi:hypothetical protein